MICMNMEHRHHHQLSENNDTDSAVIQIECKTCIHFNTIENGITALCVQWELLHNIKCIKYEVWGMDGHGENIRNTMTPMISRFIFQFCAFSFDALDEIDGLKEKLASEYKI